MKLNFHFEHKVRKTKINLMKVIRYLKVKIEDDYRILIIFFFLIIKIQIKIFKCKSSYIIWMQVYALF